MSSSKKRRRSWSYPSLFDNLDIDGLLLQQGRHVLPKAQRRRLGAALRRRVLSLVDVVVAEGVDVGKLLGRVGLDEALHGAGHDHDQVDEVADVRRCFVEVAFAVEDGPRAADGAEPVHGVAQGEEDLDEEGRWKLLQRLGAQLWHVD